jgi:AcrR family transcriptional regulator
VSYTKEQRASTPGGDAPVPDENGWDRGKRQRRERILRAARDLLREHPERGFTVPLLAERARVSQATVFNLVGARDQIWAALAREALGELGSPTRAIDDPRTRVLEIVDTVVEAIANDPPVVRRLILDWTDSGRALELDPTGDLIRCFAQAGAADSAAGLGELVAMGIVGGIHQWAASILDADELRRRFHQLVDVTFASIDVT